MARKNWKDYLKIFLACPAVVGSEQPLINCLTREFEELGLEVNSYIGLLEVKGKKPESNIFSVHIDRHGLVSTAPGEYQYAAHIARYQSSFDDQFIYKSTRATLDNWLNRFVNKQVNAYSPWSGEKLIESKIAKAYYCRFRNNVIFSLDDKIHLPAGISLGYRPKITEDNNYISAQLDNVLMVALVADLFASGYEGTALFSCQEESGRSWIFIQEYFIRLGSPSKNLLVLDTSPFPSRQEADAQSVVLRFRDQFASFDEYTTLAVQARCEKLNLNYSLKDKYLEERHREENSTGIVYYGKTELGRLIKSSENRISGTSIQIPTTNYHTNEETANLKAIEDTLTLLKDISLNC